MTQSTGWIARAGAILSEAKGPWGKRGSEGGGDDGDGAGPRNPWAQPPGRKRRGQGGSSALDQLADRLRGLGGGGGSDGGSGGGGDFGGFSWPALRIGLLFLAAIWIALTSIWVIAYNERGVVTTFGAYSRTLESGVGLTLPWPIEKVTKVNSTENRKLPVPNDGEPNFILTGDQNIVDLAYVVTWNVADPEKFIFQLADPEKTVQEVADSAMRAAVSRATFSGAIGAQKTAIANDAANRMRKLLEGYNSGVNIINVAITSANPPKEVNDSFKDVQVAQQEAEGAINDANTYKAKVTRRAEGDAAAFNAVYEQYKAAPDVTKRRRYYETMEDILSKTDKVIVETPGAAPYFALPELKKRDEAAKAGGAK